MELITLSLSLSLFVFHTNTLQTTAQRNGALDTYEVASFQNPASHKPFNHVLFHQQSGNVYLAAVDSLYRLNVSLGLQSNISTAETCTGVCVPNYNKILFVDPTRNQLVICGSGDSGVCQLRQTDDLVVVGDRNSIRVASGDNSTTVGVLALGPGNDPCLYVAAAYQDSHPEDPPISRRILRKLSEPKYTFTRTIFSRSYRSSSFDINYVYGFTLDRFVYFIAAQAESSISKIVRVCQDALEFTTYSEITLQCGPDTNQYNMVQSAYFGKAGTSLGQALDIDSEADLLYAVFAKNIGISRTLAPGGSSALCIFRMNDIEQEFVAAFESCAGSGTENYVDFLQDGSCKSKVQLTNVELDLCNAAGLRELKYPRGENPVVANSLFSTNSLLSSIITSIEMGHTVAFLGTASGDLLKVHLESGTSGRHYETVNLGASSVLSDISLDDAGHLHLLTQQQLLRLKVSDCGQYTSCEECIVSESARLDADPYCGWCTLYKRCSRHIDCPSADSPSHWIPYNATQCLAITHVEPVHSRAIYDDNLQKITLTMQQLPVITADASYSCQFNDVPMVTEQTAGDTIDCTIPDRRYLPPIPPSEDHITLVLSVFSSSSNLNFISTTFSFYNCSRHASCGACVQSNWACSWCIYSHKCTSNTESCSQGDSVIAGINNPVMSTTKGPAFCPQLQLQQTEILISVGIPTEITVVALNLPDPAEVDSYQCSLLVEGTSQNTLAYLADNDAGTIICSRNVYTYETMDNNELSVALTVTWNGDRSLDDFNGIMVTLYKCEVDRSDCSRCLSADTARPELQCGWCGTDDRCVLNNNDMCSTPVLGFNDACPPPQLQTVFPSSGPVEGNTIIDITGSNIGRAFDDVISVTVGSNQCILSQDLQSRYITGKSVSCVTPQTSTSGLQPITVTVRSIIGDSLNSDRMMEFSYKNPTITGFSPSVGPAAGGTLLTITGTDINTGRDIQAVVASNSSICDRTGIIISDTALQCRTTNSTENTTGLVSIIFDEAVRNSVEMFTYQPNPTVIDMQPQKSIKSGGRLVTVNGTYFSQIAQPMIISTLMGTDEIFTGECDVVTDTTMICQTPSVASSSSSRSSSSTRRARQNPSGYVVGFVMDNVVSLRNWSLNVGYKFDYVNDPMYAMFSEEGNIRTLESSKLQIEGENLNAAITKAEITVYVGTQICAIRDRDILSMRKLTCFPPESQPEPLDYRGQPTTNGLPAVYVRHGSHGRLFFVGYLRYVSEVNVGLFVGVAVGVALLPLLLLAVVCWQKLRGSQKEIVEILIQMDELEESMAEDLRIAFAQLQTNVSDLTHDLAGTGMPFVSHRQYATNMLFIGLDIQPLSSDPKNPEEDTERAMMTFNRLLANKSFLLTFIQSLDNDKRMPVKDKVTIASLITVVMLLENKLGYLTDVMVTLMSHQVVEAVDHDRPKQLFRRTETIVEKLLSNWISLCLYDQLKYRTAYPLFLLYSSIKVQTEKGPVDAITKSTHFSLSEECLLRGSVSFKEMTLRVVDTEDEKEVKVLDVDAIPQVKEKILDAMYRNKAYSDRQRAGDVNLEWRQGKIRIVLQGVPLSQMDSRRTDDAKWRKLNTLQELGVPNNSTVALIPKPKSLDVPHEETADTTDEYQPEIDLEEGVSLWHLEKPQDEDNQSKRKKKKQTAFSKNSQDVTFPRLLTMKGIIQEYVDMMFEAILTVDATPAAIKYLFDFFDSQAARYDIHDPNICHIWKSNTLPLRFWANSITHPNYIFDICPTPSIEASLGVVGQAFYDTCNKADHQLGRESHFNKLLYNREVNKYRPKVEGFYEGIANMSPVTQHDLEKDLEKTCNNFSGLFSKHSTLLQLYQFVSRNSDLIVDALNDDPICEENNIAQELEAIQMILEGNETSPMPNNSGKDYMTQLL